MNIEILCSLMTSKIYAVRKDRKGNIVEKIDVTRQAINAVSQHMDQSKVNYECQAGELMFVPKAIETTEPAQAEEKV